MQKYNNIYFIESTNIKVFPCAYRGTDSGNIYDPEANVFTEYNFANIYGKQTKLISWSKGLLKCVIDGYYFEIKNIAPANLCIDNELYKFKIVTAQLTIVDGYNTEVLTSIGVNNINYLDTTIEGTDCFTGLAIVPVDENTNGAIYFSPCKSLTNKDGTKTAVIDWQAYRLTDALNTGEGDGSARMLGTVKNDKSTVCKAAGENAFAIGKNTEANGNFSIAGGTESKAEHENSVAIGDHVNTSAASQAVFGAYNKENENAALIIGNGTSADKNNILEVSKSGNINATGKLDVAGNISSSKGGITLKESGFINITHNYKEPGSDEVKTRSSLLKENGDLKIDGDVQFNETLTVEKQTEIKGNIIGRGNLTISGAGKTHALALGSNDGIDDYGSITVYGKKLVDGQKTKITAFSVDTEGAAKIAKTLAVGANALVVNEDSVNINNSKVTVATDTTTINNKLTVNGTATITDDGIITTINKGSINYNSGKFIVTNNGDITANSLTLAGVRDTVTNNDGTTTQIHYGIDKDGKIIGTELTLKNNYKIAEDGNATLKDLIVNNTTLAGIRLEKGNYSVKDTDDTRAINNSDALKITRYIENSDSGIEEATQGLHVNGKITAAGDFAIGESSGATTKITQGGTAYFKQGLLVGGKVTGANEPDDNVTFRIASFSSEAEQMSCADLKGDLNVKKYNNKAGNLTVDGNTTISGSLTIGNISFNKNNITGITKIQAKTFDAISDMRKKTAIQDYICKKSILDLPVKEFEFIDDETHTKNIGCIAQDLQEICPEIVHEDKDGYLSIEETKLVYLLLQEVKELKKEIKELKGE